MGYLANPGSVLEGANIQYTNSVAELHFFDLLQRTACVAYGPFPGEIIR